MPETWKPDGYSSVSPYLVVRAADAVVEFLRTTFGAVILVRLDDADGSLVHAELRIGDSVVMLGGAGDRFTPVPAHVHVYVDDVDGAYRRGLQAGGTMVQAPERQGAEPDRRAGLRDPGGVTWWIATRVAPHGPEPVAL